MKYAILTLMIASPALAQINMYETKIGNTTFGSGYDARSGESINSYSNQIGNTRYDTINQGGRTTSCTTTVIGGQSFTNCY